MISDEKQNVLKLFSEGRKFYKLMQFKDALNCFQSALEIDPEDGPSKVYKERCSYYISNPPEDDWDGVYIMTHK